MSYFKGVGQNMSSNLESVKDMLVFLGKSLFSILEALFFQLIPKPKKNVAGEIVLITGAGSGLGRLLALQFARLGSVLVLWDVNKEANEETLQVAREAGATRVYAYTCDCSQREEVYRVADQVRLGGSFFLWVVGILGNYFGMHQFCSLASLSQHLPIVSSVPQL